MGRNTSTKKPVRDLEVHDNEDLDRLSHQRRLLGRSWSSRDECGQEGSCWSNGRGEEQRLEGLMINILFSSLPLDYQLLGAAYPTTTTHGGWVLPTHPPPPTVGRW